MKALVKRRADLKLIVASATLNTRRFAGFFNNCPIIEVC
jgi:HrpA-like RNA helicase